MTRWTILAALAAPALVSGPLAGPLQAEITAGVRTIALTGVAGERRDIATLHIAADGSYRIDWKAPEFDDFFLSMRPFKCLTGPDKHWCHVPYPYAIDRNISGGDLRDLEYDLLFLWKGATEYGINMWNGVYYRLEQQGDRLIGQMYEMDMDLLSAPPEPGNLRPLQPGDLHETDPDSHWLPGVVIE